VPQQRQIRRQIPYNMVSLPFWSQSLLPIPSWNSLHPLVVHFPVVLLLVAPMFILLAIAFRIAWKPLGIAALVLLVMGTAGAALAVATGEAAEGAAKAITAAAATLDRHEEQGELVRNLFVGLTAGFAVILMAALLHQRLGRRIFMIASGVFLIPYAAGAAVLADTAHEGGLLVHHYGVHAPIGAPAQPTASRHRDGDD
jgi:uncharacterized membrane protein